jgi:hypothetical protein
MAAVLGDNHLQVEDVGTVPCSGSLSRKHHGRRSKAVHHGYTYEQRRDGRREAAKSFFLGIPLDKDLELSSSTETSTPISQRLPSIQPLAINDTAAMTITSPSIISEFHFQRDLSIESPRRSKRRKSLSQSKRGPHHNVPTQSIISLTKYISDPHDKRVLFTYGGHPVIAYSILPYQKPFKKSEGAGGTGRVRTNSINAHLEIDGIDDFGDPTKETSLVGFLEPLWTAHEQSESPVKKHAVNVLIHQGSFREETPPPPPPTLDSKVYPWNIFRDNHTPEFVLVNYHPDCLDNPEHFFRRHVTTLNLTSYRVSLLKYAKENEVKKEINKQFADVFPHVKLTLSKLKSIKKDMISVGIEVRLHILIPIPMILFL